MPFRNNKFVSAKSPVSGDDCSRLEKRIGESLPSDLRSLFLENNGGQLQQRNFTTKSGHVFVLHEFLAITPETNRGFELSFNVSRKNPGFLPADLVPFAVDEGGALYCLSRADGSVLHFDPEEADHPERAITYLAPSLQAFIENMQ